MPKRKSDSDEPEESSVENMPTSAHRSDAPHQQHDGQGQRPSMPNHIFVGKKPVMSYAMSALIQLTQAGEITVKARGLAISRAVDVAEIVTKRLGNGQFKIKDIGIDTEVVGEGAEQRNISSIQIVVGK